MFKRKLLKELDYIQNEVKYATKYKKGANFEIRIKDYAGYIENNIKFVKSRVNRKQDSFVDTFLDKEVYTKLGSIVLLNDDLFNRVFEFYKLDDENNYDFYKLFVLQLLDDISYRVFNYPRLEKCINVVFEKFDFSNENIDKYMPALANDYMSMINGKIINYQDYNNEFCEDKASKLVEIIKRYNDYKIDKENQAIKAEQERIQKELDEYKKKKYSIDATIVVNRKGKTYPPCVKKEYDYVLRGFRRMNKYRSDDEIYSDANALPGEALITDIVVNSNPFAVLAYLRRVIDGEPFNPNLLENINFVLNEVNLKTTRFMLGVKGENSYVTVICKYLMIYFGIGQEANKEKAEQYLMISCKAFYTNVTNVYYLERLLGKKYLCLLLNYPENVDVYGDYKNFFMMNEIKNMTFKAAKKYLTIKRSELSDEEICKQIDTVYIDKKLHDALCDEFKDIYVPYHEAIIKKQQEEARAKEEARLKEIEEKNRQKELLKEQLEKVKEKANKINVNVKEYSKEEIEELKEKTDDAKAMWDVAEYYFKMKSSDRMKFVTAHKYYVLSGNLGASSGHVNAAISYFNASNDLKGDHRKNLIEEAISLLVKYAETNDYCVYYYFMSYFRTNRLGDSLYCKKLLDIYKEKYGEDKEIYILIKAASYAYARRFKEAIELYNKIKYKITNTFFIESFTSLLAEAFLKEYREKNNRLMNAINAHKDAPFHKDVIDASFSSNPYKETGKLIFELYQWALNFNCKKIMLDAIDYSAEGNIIFNKDRAYAYQLIKSLNGNYYDRYEHFENLFNTLKQEFEGK